jgi:RND superfamily putative drug exporter
MPGVLELIGERNWFMPRWLDRILPNLSVEGDPKMKKETADTQV